MKENKDKKQTIKIIGFIFMIGIFLYNLLLAYTVVKKHNKEKIIVDRENLLTPRGIYSDGKRLYIADSGNNRILIYNRIPNKNNAKADIVIGQPDFESNLENQGGKTKANTLYFPTDVFTDGKRLYIADSGNNRILIYNRIPNKNNAKADIVIGQPDFESNLENQGGKTKANTLYFLRCFPTGIFTDGKRLYIADSGNNRILIYNRIPNKNNAKADIVIGQPDFESNLPNQGKINYLKTIISTIADWCIRLVEIYTVQANTLKWPEYVFNDGERLYISDTYNHRILIYNKIPYKNNISADVVIGQKNLRCGELIIKNNVAQNSFVSPNKVFKDNQRLYIAHGAISIFNRIPETNNASADIKITKFKFNSNSHYFTTTDIFSDGKRFYVSDIKHNLILIYNKIPDIDGVPVDIVIGQISDCSCFKQK